MSNYIFPSENSVGTFSSSPGRILREPSLAKWVQGQRTNGRKNVISGLELSKGFGLSVNVSSGYAFIDGYIVGDDAQNTVSGLTAIRYVDEPNFVYLTLVYTSGLASGISFSSNTTGVVPASSVCLGIAATDGSSVTSYQSSIKNAGATYIGQYTGRTYTPSAYRFVFLGHTPRFVCVQQGIASDLYFGASSPDGVLRSIGGLPMVLSASSFYVPVPINLGFKVTGNMNSLSSPHYFLAALE